MSRRLTEEEKRRNKLKRQEKAAEKEAHPPVDKYGIRILIILKEEAHLHPEIKYNAEYFAKQFDVAAITVRRSIRKLKQNNLIEERPVDGTYVIKEGFNNQLLLEHASNEIKKQVALIASLGGILKQYKNTPLYESVKNLLYFLQPEIVKGDDVFASGRVIVSPQMEYNINTRNWEKVYEAMQKNNKIKFRYTKPYSDTESQRIVWPFQLILENGSVYLFAYSEWNDIALLYDLNYMAEVVILRDTFNLPENYDISNYSGGGRLGAYAGDTIEQYKIRFTDYAKEWMKNHKLADDQTYTEDEDSTTISFTSSQFDKVLQLILRWGRQAEPLAPARLVERWKDEVLAMAELVKEG